MGGPEQRVLRRIVPIALAVAACAPQEGRDPMATALDGVGLPPSALTAVTTTGAPAFGASSPAVDVLAFLDPVDPASSRTLAHLRAWSARAPDVRVAVRLRPLAVHPRSRFVAGQLRAQTGEAFWSAWSDPDLSATSTPTRPRSEVGEAAVAADVAEADRLGVDAVPTVFINGFRLVGPHPVENYEAVASRFRKALGVAGEPGGFAAIRRVQTSTAGPAATRARSGPQAFPRRAMLPEEDSPSRGARAPAVTIMFFADFTCEHSRAQWKTLKGILRRTSDVQVRFRHFPVGARPHARPAARAAIAASLQGRFWRMVELLFAARVHDEKTLRRSARKAGLDLERFDADRRRTELYDKLDADRRAAERLGVQGAPLLAVNGVRMVGAQSEAVLFDRIVAERARARRLLRAGVARGDLQVETARRNAGQPVPAAPPRRRNFLAPRPGPQPQVDVFVDATCPYSAAAMSAAARAAAEGARVRVHLAPRPVPFARSAADLWAADRSLQGGQVYDLARDPLGQALLWAADEIDGARLRSLAEARSVARPARARGRRRVARDLDLAARAGVQVVPAVFVNGWAQSNPLDDSTWRAGRIETVKGRTLEARPPPQP